MHSADLGQIIQHLIRSPEHCRQSTENHQVCAPSKEIKKKKKILG